jgi:predicted metal-dependent phosphoesterase TrpH
MYKIDFHTHSVASHDGGINGEQYRQALESGQLDYVAITDHNTIDFAQHMHGHLGEKIIIGEEIMTTAGEIIGLYLSSAISPGLSPQETVQQIRAQGGLVYIPHPLETIRRGLRLGVLDELRDQIDIIEIVNGRAFLQNRSERVVLWARMNNVVGAASSDAHGPKGLGHTYTIVKEPPSVTELKNLLAKSTPVIKKPTLRALLYPKYNKLRKKVKNG